MWAIHGITKFRVENIAKSLKSNIVSQPDMRGRHLNRPNKIPENVVRTVHDHIRSFPRRSSHYSREKNDGRYYLPAELNVTKMHKLFLQKYEPKVFAEMQEGKECKVQVTYDYYHRYFLQNFNISFGSPRSDTCQTCDRLQNMINAEQDIENKASLQVEKQLHIRKSEVFYTSLKEKSVFALNDPTVEVLCFDYEQNLPLPHIPAGDVFYKRQLWVYNFCIHSAKSGTSVFYMYDEVTSKKGSNEVISFLHHYLNTYLPGTVQTLFLFSDNAFAQNKNQTLVKYLYTLTNINQKGILKIIHQYPEPGHSFLPCDRSFALIEKAKRRKERVHTPDEWKDLVRTTSKKFTVINVNQDMIMDFATHLKPFFKTTFINKEKIKFSISTYRLFQYQKTINYVECSVSAAFPVFTRFYIQKENVPLSLPSSRMIQPYPLPLKEKKAADVKLLSSKYVPPADLWYYRLIFGEPENNEVIQEVNNAAEDVYDSDSSFM